MNHRIRSNKPVRKFFKEQWAIFETKINERKSARKHKRKRHHVESRIEELVENTDTSIRILSHYKKSLRDAVHKEIDYVSTLADKINPIISLNANEDIINVLFYEQAEIDELITQTLAKNKKDIVESDNVFALIIAKFSQKTVFKSALIDGKVINDVRAEQFQFHHKKLVKLNICEQGLVNGITAWLHKQMVEQLRFALKPELASPYGQHNNNRLEKLKPTEYVESLNILLANPEQFIRLETKLIQLDKHYAFVENEHQEVTYEFELVQIVPKVGEPLAMVPICYKRTNKN